MKKKIVMLVLAGALMAGISACGAVSGEQTASRASQNDKAGSETGAEGGREAAYSGDDAGGSGDDTEDFGSDTDTDGAGSGGNQAGADSDGDPGGSGDQADPEQEKASETDDSGEGGNTEEGDGPTSKDDTSPADTSQSDPKSISVNSPEDGVTLLEAIYGTEDFETGNTYSFAYLGTFTIEDKEFYGYQWSWLVDGDHKSKISDVLIQTDGSAVYQGFYNGEEWEEVYFEENQLDRI